MNKSPPNIVKVIAIIYIVLGIIFIAYPLYYMIFVAAEGLWNPLILYIIIAFGILDLIVALGIWLGKNAARMAILPVGFFGAIPLFAFFNITFIVLILIFYLITHFYLAMNKQARSYFTKTQKS